MKLKKRRRMKTMRELTIDVNIRVGSVKVRIDPPKRKVSYFYMVS